MENLSDKLHEEALSLGLCNEWSSQWKSEDGQVKLIERYKKGFDFALKHNWPSPEFIEENFDRGILHENMIWNNEYIHENDESKNGVYIVNGRCTGTLRFGWYAAATVNVRHDSDITIDCSGASIVIICLYNNAKVRIIRGDSSRVSVITHGEYCTVYANDGVRVRRK